MYNTYVLGKGTVPRHETNGVNMRQSISELDSLLDDLNHAQRVGFSNSGVNRHEITTNESSMQVYLIICFTQLFQGKWATP